MAYTFASSPDGWLLCDGSTYLISNYSGLFSVIQHAFDSYGEEDLSFNVPDYRGAFLRGAGTNGGNYVGPALNASQAHATQIHNHIATSTVSETPHSHTQYTINDDFNNSGDVPSGTTPSFPKSDSAGSRTWNNINSNTTGITVATAIADSTTNTNTYETRPYNYGVWWIIKY